MTDVRLTATNPVDSTVVPVACNANGELLIEGFGPDDVEFAGNVTVDGSLAASSDSLRFSNGLLEVDRTSTGGNANNAALKVIYGGVPQITLKAGGSAVFNGDVTAPNITTFASRIEATVAQVQDLESLKAGLLDAVAALRGS